MTKAWVVYAKNAISKYFECHNNVAYIWQKLGLCTPKMQFQSTNICAPDLFNSLSKSDEMVSKSRITDLSPQFFYEFNNISALM